MTSYRTSLELDNLVLHSGIAMCLVTNRMNGHSNYSTILLTLLNDVPSFTSGTDGKDLSGFMTRLPDDKPYRLLMMMSRSDVVFTGKKRCRGTLIPVTFQKTCVNGR